MTDEVVTPSALTKQQLHAHYSRPEVQKALLEATRGRDVAILQSFSPEKQVFRRYVAGKEPIRFSTPEEFYKWQTKRMAEVHPVFGAREDILLADIDPGPSASWKRTKELARAVAERFATEPGVQSTSVQFTGGRGFHVKGKLETPIDIDEARRRSQAALATILEAYPETTLSARKTPEQIRLDTTPLHRSGSIRAPYSLNIQTGMIAAPVDLKELPTMQKKDFTIEKTAAAEFAPGIPASRETQPIPEVIEPTDWNMVVQRHDALRAGPHWDLRLIDPTGAAHSFAIPKRRFPALNERMLLALQQPTHTADYAYGFEGEIPKGTYGAGTVAKELQEKVRILSSGPNKILFERPDGSVFSLFRTRDNKWGFKQSRPLA